MCYGEKEKRLSHIVIFARMFVHVTDKEYNISHQFYYIRNNIVSYHSVSKNLEKCRFYRKVLIVNIAIIVMVTMSYKTINVAPQTYEKLILYKHGNMSFDDVLNEFMKIVEEKDFYSRILQEHKKRMRKMKSKDFIESDSLEDALANV